MRSRRALLRSVVGLAVGAALAVLGVINLPAPTVFAMQPYYPYQCPFVSGGFDFNGAGYEQIFLWNPRSGLFTAPGEGTSVVWGQHGDIPVPGDYNNDGRDDVAIWRPLNGTWYVKCSSTANCATGNKVFTFGTAGDIPVPADYDNDGYTDYGVWRPDSGVWYVQSGANTSTALVSAQQWGEYGDCPLPGRLLGSGAGPLELNVFRPETGAWYEARSLSGTGGSVFTFGIYGDIPFVLDADSDGDGDEVVWRPSNGVWYGAFPSFAIQWGLPSDIPVIGYGYSALTDPLLQVFRPTTRQLYFCAGPFSASACTTASYWGGGPFGATGDVPLSAHSK